MNPVLQSVLAAAVAGTGASYGWVLGLDGDGLKVVAAAGPATAGLVGATVPSGTGTAGFVVSSGQPMALAARPDDERASEGVPALLGLHPASVLCVPCTEGDDIVGAVELVDRPAGGPFTFDDVELVSLLAGIAGAALRTAGGEVAVRPPAELAAELAALAALDPIAYARVATVVDALLARG